MVYEDISKNLKGIAANIKNLLFFVGFTVSMVLATFMLIELGFRLFAVPFHH